ncbi:MAG: FHA domain-containing protein [Bdellovibrionales bacterium]|nr:FHA domain-containing protein [Bdellovibrionales bacterium]
MIQEAEISILATHGLLQGQSFLIDPDATIFFGRIQDNDVVLPEHAISRQHAKLTNKNGSLWIEDLSSKNGTYVNGKLITPDKLVELQSTDTFQLGSTIFKIVSHERTVQESPVIHQATQSEKSAIRTFSQHKETKKEKQKLSLPKLSFAKINKRVLLYGIAGIILIVAMTSSRSSKKAKPSQNKSAGSSSEIQIEIPQQFATDHSQSKKTPTLAETEVLISQAESAIRFEDYHKAIRIYERILKARPEDEKILSYYDIAKKNLYRKIQVNRDIALIEFDKLNYEKAKEHWQRIADLTDGLDLNLHQEAEKQIKSLEELIQ